MYREASLRVPCILCRVEQPLARLELSPRGGHWCWRCQLSAQIAEHAPRGLYGAPPGPLSRIAHGLVIAAGIAAAVLAVGYILLGMVAVVLFRC